MTTRGTPSSPASTALGSCACAGASSASVLRAAAAAGRACPRGDGDDENAERGCDRELGTGTPACTARIRAYRVRVVISPVVVEGEGNGDVRWAIRACSESRARTSCEVYNAISKSAGVCGDVFVREYPEDEKKVRTQRETHRQQRVQGGGCSTLRSTCDPGGKKNDSQKQARTSEA